MIEQINITGPDIVLDNVTPVREEPMLEHTWYTEMWINTNTYSPSISKGMVLLLFMVIMLLMQG